MLQLSHPIGETRVGIGLTTQTDRTEQNRTEQNRIVRGGTDRWNRRILSEIHTRAHPTIELTLLHSAVHVLTSTFSESFSVGDAARALVIPEAAVAAAAVAAGAAAVFWDMGGRAFDTAAISGLD